MIIGIDIRNIGKNRTGDEVVFFNLVKKLRKGMKDVLSIKTVCFFQNEATHHNLFHMWIFPRYEWMEKYGDRIQSIRLIIDYAKENMVNDKISKEVKDMVKKMSDYMK